MYVINMKGSNSYTVCDTPIETMDHLRRLFGDDFILKEYEVITVIKNGKGGQYLGYVYIANSSNEGKETNDLISAYKEYVSLRSGFYITVKNDKQSVLTLNISVLDEKTQDIIRSAVSNFVANSTTVE